MNKPCDDFQEMRSTYFQSKHDAVNSPSHYKVIGSYEAIDIIKAQLTEEEYKGYLKGNILKYTLRADKKNGTEDRKKAIVYSKWLVGLD